jgi:hypothetical protein
VLLLLLPGCAALPGISAALGMAVPALDAAFTAEQRARAAQLAPGLPAEDPALTAIALRLAAVEAAQRGVAAVPPSEAFATLRELAQLVTLLAGEVRVAQERGAAVPPLATPAPHNAATSSPDSR